MKKTIMIFSMLACMMIFASQASAQDKNCENKQGQNKECCQSNGQGQCKCQMHQGGHHQGPQQGHHPQGQHGQQNAQHHGNQHGQHGNHQASQQHKDYLNLTDDQKAKFKSIKESYEQKTQSIKLQLKEKEAHLDVLRVADKADMKAINKTVEEIGNLKIEKEKLKEAKHQELRQVLDAEQRAKYDKFYSSKKH